VASAALIVNPQATRVTPELTLAIERELAAFGKVETLLTERPLHAAELVAQAGDVERIYVFAGDGGYNEVVNGLDRDIPVGFIPGGSTSVLPRALGIPRDPQEAVQVLRRLFKPERIGVMEINRGQLDLPEYEVDVPPSEPVASPSSRRDRAPAFSA